MASICPHAAVVVIGKRMTGKTTLARDILLHQRGADDVPFASVTVVSPTEQGVRTNIRGFVDVATPSRVVRIHDEYAPAIVDAIVERQGGRAFVVLDDCMYDGRWASDDYEGTVRLVRDRRSLEATTVLTMPYPLSMPPSLREQFDYVFLLRDSVVSTRKRLYEHYVSEAFPTFDAFCQAMDRCTEDHGCLVIDRTGSATRVFRYKAYLHVTASSSSRVDVLGHAMEGVVLRRGKVAAFAELIHNAETYALESIGIDVRLDASPEEISAVDMLPMPRDAISVCSLLVDRLLTQRDVEEVGDLLRALRTSTRLPAASLAVSVPPEWRTRLPARPDDAHAFFGWTIAVRPVTKNIAVNP